MIPVLHVAAVALLAVGALLTLYRLLRGPTILDRMIASDVLLTTLMLAVGTDMVINGHTRTIPLMLALAATAIFATIAVSRYVSKQDASDPPVQNAANAIGTTPSAAPQGEAPVDD
ncbi:monovalent cation/H+ antiporter complex subunit F [Salinibacterium sp. TMP30]|uniref:monovalent cation/H+ antiporter complex subunit F n=1 Tax=Salinibacterium sp. TMP30 TaxID=3138237 RepID=UPI0031395081